jgi:hypothetical protein
LSQELAVNSIKLAHDHSDRSGCAREFNGVIFLPFAT